MKLRLLDLFSGIGGFSLSASWAGIETIAFLEVEPICCRILEKNFPGVPNLGNVKEINEQQIRALGRIDIVAGGPPCQPASCAGKRRGKEDDRWLWPEALRIMRLAKPAWAVFENPEDLATLDDGLAFELISSEMESMGYEVEAYDIPACALGAWQLRERIWIIAHALSAGREEQKKQGRMDETLSSPELYGSCLSDTPSGQAMRRNGVISDINETEKTGDIDGKGISWDVRGELWQAEPDVVRVVHGIPKGLDKIRRGRVKALGNSIVPQIAYQIFAAIVAVEESQLKLKIEEGAA